MLSLVFRGGDRLGHHSDAIGFHAFPDIFWLGSSPTTWSCDFSGIEYV